MRVSPNMKFSLIWFAIGVELGREREENTKLRKLFFFAIFLVSTIFFLVLKISTYILYIHIMYVFRNFSSIQYVNSNHFEMLNLW